jgi:hypothetical protein
MAKTKKTPPATPEAPGSVALRKELETIRQLLLLLAIKIGATTGEVGAALGVTQQRASQLIAAGKIKKLRFNAAAADEGD